MEPEKKSEGNLVEELRQLGKNISDVLSTAWESPERKRIQEEISNGLSEINTRLREEARHVSQSPTGQRLRAEADEFRGRVRSGELDEKVREEILSALRSANNLLQQAVSKMSEGRQADRPAQPQAEEGQVMGQAAWDQDVESTPMKDTGHREVHPDDVESSPDQGSSRQEIHPDDVES